eukprot:g30339.t1
MGAPRVYVISSLSSTHSFSEWVGNEVPVPTGTPARTPRAKTTRWAHCQHSRQAQPRTRDMLARLSPRAVGKRPVMKKPWLAKLEDGSRSLKDCRVYFCETKNSSAYC